MSLQNVLYSTALEIRARCPNCGTSDCEEIEEFKADLRKKFAKLTEPETALIETTSAYCTSVLDYEHDGKPVGMTFNDWHVQHSGKQTAMIEAYDALAEFEFRNPTL